LGDNVKITKKQFLEIRWLIAGFGVAASIFTWTWTWGVVGVLTWFILSIVAKFVKEIDVKVEKEEGEKKT